MRSIATVLLLAAGVSRSHARGPCDPLVPDQCLLPFPNDFYRDASTGRLSLAPDSLPKDVNGLKINPDFGGWNNYDGFSPSAPITFYFPNLALDNAPRLWNISRSLDADSPTILMDTSTGRLLPHWVELDHSSDSDQSGEYKRATLMWPSERLNDATRYVVAVRGLRDVSGAVQQPSPAFKALRDGVPSSDPDVESRRAEFQGIFAQLAKAGVAQQSLQLAFPFTTASTRTLTNDLVTMRDDALARTASSFNYYFSSVTDKPNSNIARVIKGWFMAPWYLNQVEPGPTVRIVRDAAGTPVFQGYRPVNFTLQIPQSVVDTHKPGMVMQYGHGLFGGQGEVGTSYLQAQSNEYGYVTIASDWIGLASEDAIWVAYMLGQDMSNFTMVPDRCTQGMVNALLLMHLTTGYLVSDSATIFNGAKTINPQYLGYYGNSQGGILGGVYMAASTQVTRGVLGVPGGPYALLLPRSHDFASLQSNLHERYTDTLDRAVLLPFLQILWDRADPGGYLHAIQKAPLPNTPKHQVLIHYGLGDAQVTWLGAEYIARSVQEGGAHVFASNAREGNETSFGLQITADTVTVPAGACGIVGFDFGSPTVPFINIPADSRYDVHELPRRQPTAQKMMDIFYSTGTLVNTCGGTCRNVTVATTSTRAGLLGADLLGDQPHPEVWLAAREEIRSRRAVALQ